MNMNTDTSSYTPPAHFKQSLGQHFTYSHHERILSYSAVNHTATICKDIFNFPTHQSSSSLFLLDHLRWQHHLKAYSWAENMTQAFQLHIPANKAKKVLLSISICLHEYTLLLFCNVHHMLLYVTKLKQWKNYTG